MPCNFTDLAARLETARKLADTLSDLMYEIACDHGEWNLNAGHVSAGETLLVVTTFRDMAKAGTLEPYSEALARARLRLPTKRPQ